MKALLTILLFPLLSIAQHTPAERSALEAQGYIYLGAVSVDGAPHEYYLSKAVVIWDYANALATALYVPSLDTNYQHGYLASLLSKGENDSVTALVIAKMGNAQWGYGDNLNPWIGLYQKSGSAEPGTPGIDWLWSSAESCFIPQFNNFAPGEPNNWGSENKVQLLTLAGLEGKWNDWCNCGLRFIVEFGTKRCVGVMPVRYKRFTAKKFNGLALLPASKTGPVDFPRVGLLQPRALLLQGAF